MEGSGNGELLCSKRAVLLGANVYGFTDMVSAHEFRKKAYAYAGLTQPPIQAPYGKNVLATNVTVLDRAKTAPRHITNIKETLDVVRKYGVEPNWIVIDKEETFKDQIIQMATTGVLVSIHGAGLMNQIFMQPGSVTIEIFPDHMKHVLYERVAHYAGVYHFKVYATEHPGDFAQRHADYDAAHCDDVIGLEIPSNPKCWLVVKNVVVVVPLRDFEVALAHSLDFLDRVRLQPPE